MESLRIVFRSVIIVCIAFYVCTDACVYACMPIRRLVHPYHPTQSTIKYCRCVRVTHKYTRIHLHTHIHTLTCTQTQAFNPPFVTCTYTRIHLHAHARTYAHTHTHTHTHIDKAFGERRSEMDYLFHLMTVQGGWMTH